MLQFGFIALIILAIILLKCMTRQYESEETYMTMSPMVPNIKKHMKKKHHGSDLTYSAINRVWLDVPSNLDGRKAAAHAFYNDL